MLEGTEGRYQKAVEGTGRGKGGLRNLAVALAVALEVALEVALAAPGALAAFAAVYGFSLANRRL